MIERLSSLQTFFSKFIFPPIWIGAFGLGVTKTMTTADPRSWLPIFVFWMVGSGFIYWSCARLKKVSIDEKNLYVSNYLQEIAVPFSFIGDVTQNRWLNNQMVTIHFKFPTEFGDKIVFMPTFRFFAFVGPHPVVDRLKQLAMIP